ncbi:hypothetical protein [Rhodopila sp.]|uniref:hypothetical protein n=1 Tax=Rhodopila sp. TaxID=2480087 RepID=UPI002CD56EAE|nr:hypothetical protein [Rhodopila sp.]HVZ10731.1 hypothetical protein [Rhodopila sp.]
MKYLPLAMTRGVLLAEAIRGSVAGAPASGLCGWCGSAIPAGLARAGRIVRCPGCARRQAVPAVEEVPWRLDAASAEALRRTRTWLRRV